MKRKIKLSLMLMTLIVLMPIFTGCPDETDDLKVKGMYMWNKPIPETDSGIFEIDHLESDLIKVYVDANEKVGSFQVKY